MSGKIYNNRYEIIEELDATPFTRVYKARIVENTGGEPNKDNTAQGKITTGEETKASDNIGHAGKTEGVGSLVALKKLKNATGFEKEDIDALKEVSMLRQVGDHPHVIKLIDVFVDKRQSTYQKKGLFLVMEYMKLDLHTLIRVDNYKLTEADIKSIMHQILQGLSGLHTKGILHRDVKPANILLSEEGVANISDFGSARIVKGDEGDMSPRVTTRYYRSPEMLYGAKKYDASCDIWAAGCTMAEIILGNFLFPGNSEIDQLAKIFEIRGVPTEETWPGVTELPNYIPFEVQEKSSLKQVFSKVTEEALDLLDKILTLDPSKRIFTQQALDHPYFKTGVSVKESTYQGYVKSYVKKKKQHEDEDF